MDDRELSTLLSGVGPRGRDVLRRLMRADQHERDAFSTVLIRAGTAGAADLADLLDLASIHPEVRRQVARVLGELDAKPRG